MSRQIVTTLTMANAVANGISQTQASAAGAPLYLNGSLVISGVAVMDVGRRIAFRTRLWDHFHDQRHTESGRGRSDHFRDDRRQQRRNGNFYARLSDRHQHRPIWDGRGHGHGWHCEHRVGPVGRLEQLRD